MEDYIYETEESHPNNEYTMDDFIDNHFEEVCEGFEVMIKNGTYAEMCNSKGEIYSIHASGNGDFNHHCISFEKI